MSRVSRAFGLKGASCLAVAAGVCVLGAGLGAGVRAWSPPEGHDHADGAGHGPSMPLVFSYYLPTCAINTEEDMNPARAVVIEHEGREVRFCCAGCEGKFEDDPAAALATIDEMMIEDQLPFYPITDCLVMEGHELGDDAINMIYKNRLVRFCCEGCIEDFEANPDEYLHRLDAAAAEAQGPSYPLDECVVAGHELEVGENPMYVVVGGRVIYLCCDGCLEELQKNPAQYVAMVDKARAEHADAGGR